MMKITVAITGASGTIYACRLIDLLVRNVSVSSVRVVMTKNAKLVADHEMGGELDRVLSCDKVEVYDNDDFFTSIASGSARNDAMVVVPCSMGMIGRVAGGISDDLISRAADVMLKERRKLILVPRETPLSLIHLKNMVAITEAGGVIMPAAPSFYSKPSSMNDIVDSVVERIVSHLGVENSSSYRWGEDNVVSVK